MTYFLGDENAKFIEYITKGGRHRTMNHPEMDPTFNNYNEAGDTAPVKAHLENLRLRDYFAGLAMQANLSTGFVVIDNAPVDRQHAEHARMAYAQADAMMEARKG